MEQSDLNSEEGVRVLEGMLRDRDEGVAGLWSPGGPEIGNAWSPALRLRNKNKGASQTQIPKKVAISAKPSGLPLPTSLALPFQLPCLAS